MKKYLLQQDGKFYKANLHCHTNISDGTYSPEEIKKLYMEQGYSVVAFTDHEILIPHSELCDDSFVALNGCEISASEQNKPVLIKKSCHLCMIALDSDNHIQPCWHRTKYLWGNAAKHRSEAKFDETKPDFERDHTPESINAMIKEFRDSGFFVTYNHPTWSLENYNDYTNFHGMHAMEIYNTTACIDGYFDYNNREYDDILRAGERIFCVAADDNHGNMKGFFGGFTMIKAKELSYKAITDALVDGQFYASQGPEIKELWLEDDELHISCSDAESIVFTTAVRKATVKCSDGEIPVNCASFKLNSEYGYVRITVTDKCGKRAETRAYFIDELF